MTLSYTKQNQSKRKLPSTQQHCPKHWFLKSHTKYLLCIAAQECLTTTALSGSKSLKLTATLSGGKGDVAWQQAQLFTQPIDSENDFTFDVTVTLRDP